MKLLLRESKAFNKAIEDSPLNRENISFRKKSGWLYIRHLEKDEVFSYHRKRKIELTKDGLWDKSYAYFIKKNSKQVEMKDFEEVLKVFRKWLK